MNFDKDSFESDSTSSSTATHKKLKAFSKSHKTVSIISKFFRAKKCKNPMENSKLGAPKKEYLRCKLIRRFKKGLRALSKKQYPDKIGSYKTQSEESLSK